MQQGNKQIIEGTVLQNNGSHCTVLAGEGRLVAAQPVSSPAASRQAALQAVAGDRVQLLSLDGQYQILAILPRQTRFARRSAVPMPGAHAHEQVIAANVDQVVPVFSVDRPAPRWNLLDRYLAAAESLGLGALVCITKSDYLEQSGRLSAELVQMCREYESIGYSILLTSSLTGEGIRALRQALEGRVSVLVGKSGVGKTSLLNALQPGLGRRVSDVSRLTGKGRHTTSAVELHPLSTGGGIIDTPGIREFGLWDLDDDDLASFFPEMRPFIGRCRFGLGCRHEDEPGCALRRAVMQGEVLPRRYQSYLKLKEDGTRDF